MKLKLKKRFTIKIKRPVKKTPIVRILAKDTEPFVTYLAPSCFCTMTRQAGDTEPGKEIRFKWEDKSTKATGYVDVHGDYAMVNYTNDIYLRVKNDEKLRAEYKEDVRLSHKAHIDAKYNKVEPKIKFRIGKKRGVDAVIAGKKPVIKFKFKRSK